MQNEHWVISEAMTNAKYQMENGKWKMESDYASEFSLARLMQEIDDCKRGMFPFIRQRKSLRKTIEAFNRI